MKFSGIVILLLILLPADLARAQMRNVSVSSNPMIEKVFLFG
jgi:hypothetical protein